MKDDINPGSIGFPPLLHSVFVLQQLADELLRREAGVSLSHARIMSGLVDGIRSQRQLAHELRQTEANISRQLRVMKKLGLVDIAKNKKDGRQRDVGLTAAGGDKYKTAETLLNQAEKSLLNQADLMSRLL